VGQSVRASAPGSGLTTRTFGATAAAAAWKSRGGAKDTLFLGRHPGLVRPDLADDPGPDACPSRTLREFPDDLLRQIVCRAPVDERLRWVVGLTVPTAAHDYGEPGALGKPPQALRVATQAVARHIHQARAAQSLKAAELLGDHVLIAYELPVVPTVGHVPQLKAGVFMGEGEAEPIDRQRPSHGLGIGAHRSPSSPEGSR
jgi:hypothetical protein